MRSSLLLTSLLLGCPFIAELGAQSTDPVPLYRWTTLAGRASIGNEDGPVAEARFNNPHGLVFDLTGNLYVADTGNHTIRKITPAGIVSTFAGKGGEPGSADGPGASARFKNPQGITADRNGNVYVADTGNHTIRLITPAGVVTTLAGQPGNAGNADGAAGASLFNAPTTLTVDTNGSVYLLNSGLRKISGGLVQTISLPSVLRYNVPYVVEPVAGPAVDALGRLYLYDRQGSLFRLDASGQLTELMNNSSFWGSPHSVFNDVNGNVYWIRNLNATRDRDRHGGNGIRPDGSFEPLHATFDDEYGYGAKPLGVAVDRNGNWYNTRATDHAIMRGRDTVFAGTSRSGALVDGVGGAARFESIYDLASDPAGNVWVQEANFKLYFPAPSQAYSYAHSLRRISATDRKVSTPLAPLFAYAHFDYPRGVSTNGADSPYIAISGVIPPKEQIVAPLTGQTAGPDVGVNDFVIDSSGAMWAYNGFNRVLRRPADGAWVVVAGGGSYFDELKDGQGMEARLGRLSHLSFDAEGNCYALARYQEWANLNNTVHLCFIRKITPAGAVTTVGSNLVRKSGSDTAAATEYPSGFAVVARDKFIVTYPHEVVQLDAQGNALVIAGKRDEPGSTDGLNDQVRFDHPDSVAVDAQGNLLIADGEGTTVRKGEYLGYAPVITGQPQNTAVTVGGSVQFSVTATGTTAPTYQWYFNATPFQGATTATLSFSNARVSDAGEYHVVVTNAAGSVTSAKATLTVTTAPTPPPPASSGAGGGGAPSTWFLLVLGAVGLLRALTRSPAGAR
jgi:hypothetical protein